MGDSDERVRLAVIRACGVHRSPRLVTALKRGLADRSRRLRQQSVMALASLSTRAAGEAMIEALDGESEWLRPTVADGLARLPPVILSKLNVGMRILLAELRVKPPKRLRRLAKGLASFGKPALKKLLLAIVGPLGPHGDTAPNLDENCKGAPCRALTAMGPRIIGPLLNLAEGGVKGVATSFLFMAILSEIVGRMGVAAVPRILPYFRRSGYEGGFAYRALKRVGRPAVPALTQALRKPGQSASHRKELVELIGELRGAPRGAPVARGMRPATVPRLSHTVRLGIAVCDRYIRRYLCYLSKLPAAARSPSQTAFDKLVAAWRKMAGGPGKMSLAKACRNSFQAFRKATHDVPQYRPCFKP